MYASQNSGKFSEHSSAVFAKKMVETTVFHRPWIVTEASGSALGFHCVACNNLQILSSIPVVDALEIHLI